MAKSKKLKIKIKTQKKCIDLWTKQKKSYLVFKILIQDNIKIKHTQVREVEEDSRVVKILKYIYVYLWERYIEEKQTFYEGRLTGNKRKTRWRTPKQSKLTLCFDVFILKPKQKQKSSTKNIFVYYRDNQNKTKKKYQNLRENQNIKSRKLGVLTKVTTNRLKRTYRAHGAVDCG